MDKYHSPLEGESKSQPWVIALLPVARKDGDAPLSSPLLNT